MEEECSISLSINVSLGVGSCIGIATTSPLFAAVVVVALLLGEARF